MNKILLVEPPYKTKHLPLALQKIATYHLNKKDEVKFFKGNMPIFNKDMGIFFIPDIIYITSMFTYQGKQTVKTVNHYKKLFPDLDIKIGGIFPTLMPEYLEEKTGIKPHIGLWPEIDKCLPNFDLFKNENYKHENGIVFTSRGCIRKCEFCAVQKLEPKSFIQENWREQIENVIKNNCKKIFIQDNNFTATPWKHQIAVINYIAKNFPKTIIDFNQGLDCRIFKEKHAKLYSKINIQPIRFAFDGMQEDGYYQKAVKLCYKYEVIKKQEIMIYALYNFNDSPEDFWYRIKEIILSKAKVFPMKYSPINSLSKKYIDKNWTEKMLKNFGNKMRRLSPRAGPMISFNYENKLDEIIGKTPEEFVLMLNNDSLCDSPSIYEKKQKRKQANLQPFKI